METKLKRFLEEPGKQMMLYIAGGVATVLMAAVICCNLLLIVSNIREPSQMPSVFGIRPAIVLSGSMSPTFEAGDVILLKKTKKPDELEVGDVACYLYSGKATTHRIIERFEAEGKPRYIMKGDYNNVEDRLAVDSEQIQGVWTGGRIRHLGKFLMFLQSTMGMFVFLICPLAGLLGWDIWKRRKADSLRLERQMAEDSEGHGYEEGRDTAGWGRIAALRGILGHPSHGENRQGDPAYQRQEPGSAREKHGVYTEAERQRNPADHIRRNVYTDEDLTEPYQEEEIPRPVRRRPPVQERKRNGVFYQTGEFRAPRESREQAAGRMDFGFGSRADRDDEFYYYSQLDDDLDYYQELEEAAEYYRRMKESLARYRRMEAVMNRCRRLEEELSRYEALAERLEVYERQSRPEREDCHKRQNYHGRPNQSEGQVKNAGTAGVSNQGTRREPPVDHIERPGGSTPPTTE